MQAPQPAEPEPEAPVAPKLPEGAFVKSAADIEREHQEKSVAEEAEKATKAINRVSLRTPSRWRAIPISPRRLIIPLLSLRQLPIRRLLDRLNRQYLPKQLMQSKYPLPNLLKVRTPKHLRLKLAN